MSETPNSRDNADSPDPFSVAAKLTEALSGLTDELRNIRSYGQRSRHMIWGIIFSILLDVGLTVLLFQVDANANNASHEAQVVKKDSIALCQSGNAFRAQQFQLWNYVLQLPRIGGLTPQQQAVQDASIAKFKAYEAKVFAPHRCA